MTLLVHIDGEAGGDWYLRHEGQEWRLLRERPGDQDATVRIPQDDAWKLFTKRTDRATAIARFPGIRIEGNESLGGRVLEMVSIMA